MKWIFEAVDLALRVFGMVALFHMVIPAADGQAQEATTPVAVTIEI